MKRYLLVMGLLFGLVTVAESASDPLARVANSLTVDEVTTILAQNGHSENILRLKQTPAEFTNCHYHFKSLKSADDAQLCQFFRKVNLRRDFYTLSRHDALVGSVPWGIFDLESAEAVEFFLSSNLPPIYSRLLKKNWAVNRACLSGLPDSFRVIQSERQTGCFGYGTNHAFLNVDRDKSFLIFLQASPPYWAEGHAYLLKIVELNYQQARQLGEMLWLLKHLDYKSPANEQTEANFEVKHDSFQINFWGQDGERFGALKGRFWEATYSGRVWPAGNWTNWMNEAVILNFSEILLPLAINQLPPEQIVAQFNYGSGGVSYPFYWVNPDLSVDAWDRQVSAQLAKVLAYIPHEEDFALPLSLISAFSRFYQLQQMRAHLKGLFDELKDKFPVAEGAAEQLWDPLANPADWKYLQQDLEVTIKQLALSTDPEQILAHICTRLQEQGSFAELLRACKQLQTLDQSSFRKAVTLIYNQYKAGQVEPLYEDFLTCLFINQPEELQFLTEQFPTDTRLQSLVSSMMEEGAQTAKEELESDDDASWLSWAETNHHAAEVKSDWVPFAAFEQKVRALMKKPNQSIYTPMYDSLSDDRFVDYESADYLKLIRDLFDHVCAMATQFDSADVEANDLSQEHSRLGLQILYYLAHRSDVALELLLTQFKKAFPGQLDALAEIKLRFIHRFVQARTEEDSREAFITDYKTLFSAHALTDELLEILWILEFKEFIPELERLATANSLESENIIEKGLASYPEQYQSGAWQIKSHTARQLVQIWKETDLETQAKLMVTLQNHYQPFYPKRFEQSVQVQLDRIYAEEPALKAKAGKICATCDLQQIRPRSLFLTKEALQKLAAFDKKQTNNPEEAHPFQEQVWTVTSDSAEAKAARLWDYRSANRGRIKLFDWIGVLPESD